MVHACEMFITGKARSDVHYVVNLLQKSGPKVGGGNFYKLFHSINYLENLIVICIKKNGPKVGGELLHAFSQYK